MASSSSRATEARTGLVGAALAGGLALAAYTRTLAPDVLYSDSAEFQTLVYAPDTTHSTGYPVYLLLARIVGLLPLGTRAWRVNFASALGAALAVGITYLIIFRLTRSHWAGALGSGALALSYTVWSQAIIAEVYTPALALYTFCLLRLWAWQNEDTPPRWRPIFVTALLVGLGLGIHASVGLLVPVVAFVAAMGPSWRATLAAERRRAIGAAALGGLTGILLFVAAFVLIDLRDTPGSFVNVALLPSRSIWGLSAQDLARPEVRLWVTVSGLQWRDAMLSGGLPAAFDALRQYGERLIATDFTPLTLLLAASGLVLALRRGRWLLPAALLAVLVVVANYHPGDWYVFFLPSYPLIAVAAGIGLAAALNWTRTVAWPGYPQIGRAVATLLAVAGIGGAWGPILASRLPALRQGIATFSAESYVYPVQDPTEPRTVAEDVLAIVPDGAVLVWDWRSLYSIAYVAHAENRKPGIVLYEATPHGSDGRVAGSLLETIDEALAAGLPVYVDMRRDDFHDRYRLTPVGQGRFFELTYRP